MYPCYIVVVTHRQDSMQGRMLFCLCVTTNLVDTNKLNTLGQVSCFILVCCLGRDKQLSVKKHMLVQQLSFMLCGCLVMSTMSISMYPCYTYQCTHVIYQHTHAIYPCYISTHPCYIPMLYITYKTHPSLQGRCICCWQAPTAEDRGH